MPYVGRTQGAVQAGYFDQPLDGFPGQLATVNDPWHIDAYPFSEDIQVGLGVVQGTDITETSGEYYNIDAPFDIALPVGTSVVAQFIGIVYRGDGVSNDANGNAQYEEDTFGSVVRTGRVHVNNPVAVSAGDPVWMYIDNATAHGRPIGSFTNADAGSGDTIQITNARWWKRAVANEIAVIELGYIGGGN